MKNLKYVFFDICMIFLSLNLEASWPQAAFGELLVAQPVPVVQLQFPYNINSRYVIQTPVGSGTLTQANSMLVLQTGAAINSSATLQSVARLQYQPGQGAACLFTSIYTAGVLGSTQLTGIGTVTTAPTIKDGFFFGYIGATFGIVHYNAGNADFIPQSSWNHDPFDGSGPSGVTLDPTKGNIYKIQFQWLGFGAIKFFIESPVTGGFVLVHQIQYPNANIIPSISNPSLQLMSQVVNTTNATNITLKNGSLAAFVEGLAGDIEIRNNIGNSKTVTTSLTNVLNIRNNGTFNGKTNQISVIPQEISFFNPSSSSGDALFTIYLNPTLTGASYTNIDSSTSVVSYDTVGTISSPGTALFSFFIRNGASFSFNLNAYNVILNPGDLLLFACKTTSGTDTIYGSVSWIERF